MSHSPTQSNPSAKSNSNTNVNDQPLTLSSASNRLAPFNPTSNAAQTLALQLFNLQSDDVLFDLGCGDGRFLLLATEYALESNPDSGLQCVGIECNPIFVSRAQEAISANGFTQSVDVRLGDVMESLQPPPHQQKFVLLEGRVKSLSLMDATAVFVYLVPTGLKLVKSLLESVAQTKHKQLQNNENESNKERIRFRVVSYMFSIPGWKPTKTERTPRTDCPIYYYDFGDDIDLCTKL